MIIHHNFNDVQLPSDQTQSVFIKREARAIHTIEYVFLLYNSGYVIFDVNYDHSVHIMGQYYGMGLWIMVCHGCHTRYVQINKHTNNSTLNQFNGQHVQTFVILLCNKIRIIIDVFYIDTFNIQYVVPWYARQNKY